MFPFQKVHRLFILSVLLSTSIAFAQNSEPIPNPGQPADIELFSGSPAVAQPITADPIPEHPFMSPNGASNIHNDAYMSDTYPRMGVLGTNLTVESVNLGGICATITFDSHGRLITACLNLQSATLFLLDAQTLTVLDRMELPYRELSLIDLEFPAGSYFYLDEQERVVIPVVGNEIWQLVVGEDNTFSLENEIDLRSNLASDDEINTVIPDFNGLLWFTSLGGVVGTFDMDTRSVEMIQLEGERISNSLAVDETGGVFIVTDTAMYRFDADTEGRPTVTWREVYDRGSRIKPGQVSQGSGTTPTVMGQEYVTITDNADPHMQVLVYRRAAEIDGERLVCAVPVFPADRGATENSLIATAHSIIVENNYGYEPLNLFAGLSEPGMTRIDVNEAGECEVVWTSEERIPSVVSKLSLASGLVYTYTRDAGGFAQGSWFLTAIDYATGETVWRQYTGTGRGFNNNYAAVHLGADGSVYVGVTSGIVAIREAD